MNRKRLARALMPARYRRMNSDAEEDVATKPGLTLNFTGGSIVAHRIISSLKDSEELSRLGVCWVGIDSAPCGELGGISLHFPDADPSLLDLANLTLREFAPFAKVAKGVTVHAD